MLLTQGFSHAPNSQLGSHGTQVYDIAWEGSSAHCPSRIYTHAYKKQTLDSSTYLEQVCAE